MNTEEKINDQKRNNLSRTLRKNLQRRKFSSNVSSSGATLNSKKHYFRSRKFSRFFIIRIFQKIIFWISQKWNAIFGKKSSNAYHSSKRYRSFPRYKKNNKNVSNINTHSGNED